MRYLPLTEQDRAAMCAAIGIESVDALFSDIPAQAAINIETDAAISARAPHASEQAVERSLTALAERNLDARRAPCFCGAGAYRHHVPASVDHIIQRSEFLTSYTPYQPEIAQGTLQYLFEFQTQVAMLTGMDIANASMYDGATAAAEAVLMAQRVTKKKRVILSGQVHPQYRDVIATMLNAQSADTLHAQASMLDAQNTPAALIEQIDTSTACVVVQYPDFFGTPHDFTALADAAHAAGALLIVIVTEIVALGMLKAPGAMGADIVVAEGQSLGNGLNFGGPHIGLFATREKFMRQMPGRLVGETQDAEGKRGFVLTLATREQHIRRDKATSNICTNSGLCALAFSAHLGLLGGTGLYQLARLNHARAVMLADRLQNIAGVDIINRHFFNEFTCALPANASDVAEALAARQILGGVPIARLLPDNDFDNLLLIAVTETIHPEDIEHFAATLKEVLS